MFRPFGLPFSAEGVNAAHSNIDFACDRAEPAPLAHTPQNIAEIGSSPREGRAVGIGILPSWRSLNATGNSLSCSTDKCVGFIQPTMRITCSLHNHERVERSGMARSTKCQKLSFESEGRQSSAARPARKTFAPCDGPIDLGFYRGCTGLSKSNGVTPRHDIKARRSPAAFFVDGIIFEEAVGGSMRRLHDLGATCREGCPYCALSWAAMPTALYRRGRIEFGAIACHQAFLSTMRLTAPATGRPATAA